MTHTHPIKLGAKSRVPTVLVSGLIVAAGVVVASTARAQHCFLSRFPVVMPFVPGASE